MTANFLHIRIRIWISRLSCLRAPKLEARTSLSCNTQSANSSVTARQDHLRGRSCSARRYQVGPVQCSPYRRGRSSRGRLGRLRDPSADRDAFREGGRTARRSRSFVCARACAVTPRSWSPQNEPSNQLGESNGGDAADIRTIAAALLAGDAKKSTLPMPSIISLKCQRFEAFWKAQRETRFRRQPQPSCPKTCAS